MSNETGEDDMSDMNGKTGGMGGERLTRTYADLLGAEPGPELIEVVTSLHHLYNSEIAPAELYALKPWVQDSTPLASSALPAIITREPQPTPQQEPVGVRGTGRRAASPQSLPRQQGRVPARVPSRFAAALSRFGRLGMAAGGATLLLGLLFLLAVLLRGQSLARLTTGTPTPHAAQVASSVPRDRLPVLDATTVFSQTIDGYTVTIGPRPQYTQAADATSILLPYTVTNWQGASYSYTVDANGQNKPRLVADAGQPLLWLGTTSYTPQVPGTGTMPGLGYTTLYTPQVPDGDIRLVPGRSALLFDASSLQPGASEHAVELTLNLHISDMYPPAPGSQATPKTTQSGTAIPRDVAAGPFVFRFRLPFDQLNSSADVHQTVSAGGVPVTLERVVSSAAEGRVFLTFASPDGRSKVTDWQPTDVLLSGHGLERVSVSALGSALPPGPNGYRGQINGWLDDHTWAGSAVQFATSRDSLAGGEWTLVVGALTNSQGWVRRVDGPWVFHFTMPPFAHVPTPPTNITYAPGLPAPTQPTHAPAQASHEPFPTVSLPGPIETAAANPLGTATPQPRPPLPVATAEAMQTMDAGYPTIVAAAALTSTAMPTPHGTSSNPLRLSNLHRLALHPDLAKADLDAISPPALAPQGDALLVSTRDHRLLLAKLDGSPPVQLADDVSQYAWSGDGRYVVYARMEFTDASILVHVPYSVTRDGLTRHKLDVEPSAVPPLAPFSKVGSNAIWESRGTAMRAGQDMSMRGLWRVPLDGGRAEFVVSMPDVTTGDVRVTHDGKRMAYLCNGGVCLQAMDGSNWTKLQTQPSKFAWSHDGSRLAVLTMGGLLIYKADGTFLDSSQYAIRSTGEIELEWTADSRFLLAYVGNIAAYGRESLVEIDTNTGYAWEGLAPDWARSFSIAPDDKRLVLRGGAAEFWIADLTP